MGSDICVVSSYWRLHVTTSIIKVGSRVTTWYTVHNPIAVVDLIVLSVRGYSRSAMLKTDRQIDIGL